MKKSFRVCLSILKFSCATVLLYILSLFFREQAIPEEWVDNALVKYLPTNLVACANSVSFGFYRGLHIDEFVIYDKERNDNTSPLISARDISINPILCDVSIFDLSYLRLNDSWYEGTGSINTEALDFSSISFPSLPTFNLTLFNPNVLGINPRRLSTRVKVRKKRIDCDDIIIDFPSRIFEMMLEGKFHLDLLTLNARGDVKGESMPELIRPLIVALDLPIALPYMDAFTNIPSPVPAHGIFDINLSNLDFNMNLSLKPMLGQYNGVKFTSAEGVLTCYSAFRDETNWLGRVTLTMPFALDSERKKLSGFLSVDMTNDLTRLTYDISSEIAWEDALNVADIFSPEELSIVRCDTKPKITIRGTSGVEAADSASNDMDFTAVLDRGAFMNLELKNLETDFNIKGTTLNFSRINAFGKEDGHFFGDAQLNFPNYEKETASFKMRFACEKGAINEFAELLQADFSELSGRVDGWVDLSGTNLTNVSPNLNGKGSISITDGYLGRLPFFSGLTKILSDYVPGVAFLVNQSQATADFTIKNGVLHTDNLFIEGGLSSLRAWGDYDIVNDKLDLTVRMQLARNDSLIGMVILPVTQPFSKLLLEFKAYGSIENPQWKYISVIDRLF